MALQTFIMSILEREAQTEAAQIKSVRTHNMEFLRLLAEISPAVEKGTLRKVDEEEIAHFIDEAREENDHELEAAIDGR